MGTGISFIICSIFYCIMLIGIFYSKKHINNIETKLYKFMMFSNLIGLFLEISNYFSVINMDKYPVLNIIVSKLYLIYLLSWITIFTLYIVFASNKNKKDKSMHRILKLFGLVYMVVLILIITLPLYFVNKSNAVYSYGPSTQSIYYVSELFIIIGFLSMFKNAKNVKKTKYASLFAYTAGGVLVMIIQSVHPEFLLMTSMETFITFLTFFTLDDSKKEVVKNINEDKK